MLSDQWKSPTGDGPALYLDPTEDRHLKSKPIYLLLFVVLFFTTRQLVNADEYDVYLLARQSNMDGRGKMSELTAQQRQPFDDAIIFYRNLPKSSDGWQPLAPGFSIAPKYKGEVPSSTFGPELGFATEMLKSNPEPKLALIKGSKGGSSLRRDWNPGVQGEQRVNKRQLIPARSLIFPTPLDQ